jgi:hypothetical protein
VESEGGRVGGRQQRPAAFLDVERHGGRHEVGHGPLGGRHDVQRPQAALHGHAHQHLARRPPPRLAAGARGRGPGAEARPPHPSEQVWQRLGPLLLQLVPLLHAAAVERRRPLPSRRAWPRSRRRFLPLPAAPLAVRRRQRRHRSFVARAASTGLLNSSERSRRRDQLVTRGRAGHGRWRQDARRRDDEGANAKLNMLQAEPAAVTMREPSERPGIREAAYKQPPASGRFVLGES